MLVLLGLVHVSGQNNIGLKPQYVLLNSPNASRLRQYGDIPVSCYTGVLAVEVPIYEIKVNGLNIPFSLPCLGDKVTAGSKLGRVWEAFNAGGPVMKNI
ncbi:hypothetical protein GCM10027566_38630 [Arachidicoccus ginsenosidivorans]|jgi:hypothetical protein